MKTAIQPRKSVADTSQEEIRRLFQKQSEYKADAKKSTYKERKVKLNKLHDAILAYRDELKEAMYADFRKHPSEVDLTEILPATSEIKHALSHLRRWMSVKRVGTPLTLLGSRSWIQYEAKGVTLIIAPWNFPIFLTLNPLIYAIAAGNTAILKPSEMTPHTSAVLARLVQETFDESEVAIVQGGVETSTALLEQPFNHIFFTGSPQVGKIVMGAAAKHLTSVTLELGGKSPTIVDASAHLKTAAKRIAWAKFMNNGQICIAPDYLFVEHKIKDAFIAELKAAVDRLYGSVDKSPDYARIVNDRHTDRILGLLEDSIEHGAQIEFGSKADAQSRYIEPTLLTNVSRDSRIMQEEIFGPILPMLTYDSMDDVIEHINAGEKPLALYIYSKNKENIKTILESTSSGGVSINHSILHLSNQNLPFGGSNHSGIGKTNGEWGFKAFSNEKAVLRQHLPSAIDLLMPPYTDFKQKLIDLTIKYL